MNNRVELLISILLDSNAREDERHDAAMDIGDYDDDRVVKALIKIASNPQENRIIRDACGESIAQIWIHRNNFNNRAYQKLQPDAQHIAKMYIYANKPEWMGYVE